LQLLMLFALVQALLKLKLLRVVEAVLLILTNAQRLRMLLVLAQTALLLMHAVAMVQL
jgi:hypothetical protein